MAKTTLLNFENFATATLLKNSLKINIRDIDEEKTNYFVAYADFGEDSFDVSIEINAKKEILSTNCDCGSKTDFCVHKIAFISQLASTKTAKKAVVKKRKISVAEELLLKLDEQTLRNWTLTLFAKNKDIEHLFVTEFSESQKIFTDVEVKIIITDSIKSVIKSKKKIDVTELKRIIEVLEVSLKPIIDYCKEQAQDPKIISLTHFIYKELIDFVSRIDSSSVRLIRYVEKIYKDIAHAIHQTKFQPTWEATIDENIKYFKKNTLTIYTIQVDAFIYLYSSIDTLERKVYYGKKFIEIFDIQTTKSINYSTDFTIFVMTILSETNMFEKFQNSFSSKRYENNYNLKLIDNYIVINALFKAATIAEEQIYYNSNDKYNVEYWQRLKQIYTLQNNKPKLAGVIMNFLPYQFNLEDYIFIKANAEEADFIKFKTKLLKKFSDGFYSNSKYTSYYFQILDIEKRYSELIDKINGYTTFEIIYPYREILFKTNKNNFLKAMKSIHYGYTNYPKNEMICCQEMINWIKSNYDFNTIKKVIGPKTISVYENEFNKQLRDFTGE